ncbi:hypothetical protein [Mycobacterium sp. RTGN5]|uniref:hypothetical protein n=1 Tax=Mycobacterium sp. RTGN5 TaxID=3016522 RepID=UPI0029C69CEF|nr:hypothetical protein [Mycobacterium sp. RTGN5]
MARILREVGGLVIAEDGPLVLVVDRGNGPFAVLAFVTGVVTLVFGGFGTVSLAAAGPAWLGIGFLAVGVAAAAVTVAVVRRIRRTRSIPVSHYRPVAVFDRAARVYRDADGRVVAPLDTVTFHRRLQWGSSSPKLVAETPSGAHVLVRGNPFTGGLGDLDTVLTGAVAI